MLGKDLQWVYPNQEDHWKISFDLNICLCDLLFASHAHLSIWFSIGLLLSQLLLSSSLEEVFSVMRFRCREGKGARGDISYSRSYLAASSQRKPNFIYTQTPSERTCPTLSKYCVNMHIDLMCMYVTVDSRWLNRYICHMYIYICWIFNTFLSKKSQKYLLK